jgi:hypothetical protein
MPTAWYKRAQTAGALTVFSKAGKWAHEVEKARLTFNNQGFPVTLNKADDEKHADIVVKLSTGPDSQTSWGDTASTDSDFDPKRLHGQTVTITKIYEGRKTRIEVTFAAVFLPAKAEATAEQREVIAVHEFIHACGLDGGLPNGTKSKSQDHDNEGIMYDIMVPMNKGLIEGSKPDGVQEMPPIRVGGKTRCKIQDIWGTEQCKKD